MSLLPSPSHPKSFHGVPGLVPSMGHLLPQPKPLGRFHCCQMEDQVLSCSRSGTLDLTLQPRLSCPDSLLFVSTATPPAKVAQRVLGHRLPGAIKIAEGPQLLNDEFWKEMIDPHS